MRTGLSKKQKTTSVFFDEASPIIEVCTYNPSLKKRLSEYAAKYPTECRLVDDDENGCLTFEIRKGRFSFKLNAPYSAERRKAASELAKKNIKNLQQGKKWLNAARGENDSLRAAFLLLWELSGVLLFPEYLKKLAFML